MKEGKLWYGSWNDYKKIRELYDIDQMVSICRYPPFRYYGSSKKLQIWNFKDLGPSPELHRWRRENMGKIDDGTLWTEYALAYENEIGNRVFEGNADKQYDRVIYWVKNGLNVCLLCTCKMGNPCHRFLLWSNMVKSQKLPFRGSDVKLDFPVDYLIDGKVVDETWEFYAMQLFSERGSIGEEHKVMLACPHVEMSAAYDRLIKKGLFGSDGPYLYLKDTALKMITKGDWEK
jgi:uncharacterized protein YeaO (DUF488 family)